MTILLFKTSYKMYISYKYDYILEKLLTFATWLELIIIDNWNR